jgi:hypothetical protein
MFRSSMLVYWLLALVALLAVAPAAFAKSPFSVLAGSTDYPIASGKAKLDETLGVLYFRVEVEDVPLAGATLDIFAGDTYAGSLTIDAFGDGRLEVAVGPGNPIAAVPAGTPVQVKTDMGVLVVSGTAP